MSQLSWHLVRPILEEALLMPEEQQAAFLDDACASNPSLRTEIESLLEAHILAQKAEALESPFDWEAPVSEAPRQTTEAGGHIGVYELVRELGHGGMGTVYLAERADGAFRQTVAIKLLRPGLNTEDLFSRFRYERQILAGLDHPHIAHLLDGGTTGDGRPYLVMEYVEGEPITDYCDRHRLSTNQRLTLFRTVCRAVAYAHRNLVVHRDLKPSNILVTEEGTVKLLDFGIAKLLNEEIREPKKPVTQRGLRLMTPEYAAPEQIRGEPVTTATDIYQLGVLLYELLTGHRPYRLVSHIQHEIERVILEEEPTRPSTAVGQASTIHHGADTITLTPENVSQARSTDPAHLQRRLSGDLDNIVLTALNKEPERRYASVEQLADDLRLHLQGFPVMARRDTFGYRATKFLRRHRRAVVVAGTIVLLVASLVSFYTARLAQERDRARKEATRAERVNTFLQEMLAAANPITGNPEATVVEILDEAADRVDDDLTDQPDVQAIAHRTIGTTYQYLGQLEKAGPHLQAAVNQHLRLYGEQNLETARSLHAQATLLLWKGDYAGAEATYSKVLALYRGLAGEESKEVAEVLLQLGLVKSELGDGSAAEALYRDAGARYRKLMVDEDARTEATVQVNAAAIFNNLGVIKYNQGDLDSTAYFYREAIAIMRPLRGRVYQVNLATHLQNLGAVYKLLGNYDEAEPLLREALDLRRRILGAKHPYVSIAQIHLGDLFYHQGHYERAEQEIREAIAIQEAVLPEGHLDRARSYAALGEILTARRHLTEAESLLRKALTIRENILPEGHLLRSMVESTLGACLAAQQRFEEAEPLLLQSYEALVVSLGANDPRTLETIQRLATLYKAWNRLDKAARYQTLIDSGQN